ncbi:exocyst complex component sec10 [Striga asiatica]|uniref:Exocyst complex component sec10 n=1 Tax=Striga asiatica TaxID=4170 RepID=A0A5A7P003_STRAF|nr:exocyst complex component sec10 [Striga asiatica]
MQGAFDFAFSNKSLTLEAPTPTNNSTNSEAAQEKNGTPASPATARAKRVFPVPGGPTKRQPLGILAPSAVYICLEIYKFLQLELGLIGTGHISKSDAGLRDLLEPGFGPAEVHGPSKAAGPFRAALGPSEQEIKPAESEEGEKQTHYEIEQPVLGLSFGDCDFDAIHGQNVNQIRVVGDDHGGLATIDGGQLKGTSVIAEPHTLDLSLPHRRHREPSGRSEAGSDCGLGASRIRFGPKGDDVPGFWASISITCGAGGGCGGALSSASACGMTDEKSRAATAADCGIGNFLGSVIRARGELEKKLWVRRKLEEIRGLVMSDEAMRCFWLSLFSGNVRSRAKEYPSRFHLANDIDESSNHNVHFIF